MSDRRQPTTTSSFGVSGRSNHDASPFYARFTPPELSDDDAVNHQAERNVIVTGDARDMTRVADALGGPGRHLAAVLRGQGLRGGPRPGPHPRHLPRLPPDAGGRLHRVRPGAGAGRAHRRQRGQPRAGKPYRSLSADVITILQDRLRLLLRGEVVWVKARGAAGSTAWGSFRQPSNPILRDLSERVIIASKGRFVRGRDGGQHA